MAGDMRHALLAAMLLLVRLAPAEAAPYKLAATPWSLRRPAPRLGEHTAWLMSRWGTVQA